MSSRPSSRGIFADTSYFIALVNPNDEAHARAVEAASRYPRIVTTEAILIELGNGLAAQRWRWLGVRLINMLRSNTDVRIAPVTPELLDRAIKLYVQHQDKEWGLTNCISFAALRQLRSTQVLTLDHHFTQAGFQILL